MNRYLNKYLLRFCSLTFFGLISASGVQAGDSTAVNPASKQLCTDVWYRTIEKQLPTNVAGKPAPEVGSDEWKLAIEQKLNVREKSEVPDRSSEGWCRYIDELVHGNTPTPDAAHAQGPSFSCDKVQSASIEAAICNDKELSALDRKLADIYADAQKKAAKKSGPSLASQQSEWTTTRNNCNKNGDSTACIRDTYFRRIAELEAVYQLDPAIGPVYYKCDGKPASEIVIMFYETDPRTLVAQRGSNSALMYIVPSGSGTRYQGRNETFWEHQDEATIVWGAGSAPMRCKKSS